MSPADSHTPALAPAPFPTPVPDHESVQHPGTGRFWLLSVAWILLYLAVVVAWGQRNSWPDDLILCVLVAPLTALVVSTLYAVYRFGIRIDRLPGQQEQLIAALILAVGIASGQLLLMSVGLVALATAWLRPQRPDVDWTEWLKIPLILLTTLPFWLDFQGNRSPLFTLFDDPICNPTFQLPLALTTTQTRIVAYCALLSLVLLLHGRAFWIVVPILPAFLLVIVSLPKWIPAWSALPATLRHLAPWVLGILLLSSLSWLALRLDSVFRRLISGETLRRWFEERRYPPWLAVLVVTVVQMVPFQPVKFDAAQIVAFAGVALMALVLLVLRWRSGRGPTHSRSVAMVAGALVLTLIAEFATNDSLRRVAIGFVLIGLLSWHCFWHLRIFVTAALLSILLLAVPEEIVPKLAGPATFSMDDLKNPTSLSLELKTPPDPVLELSKNQLRLFLLIRIAGAMALLVLLVRFSIRAQPTPGDSGYTEESWIPARRFALILLGLMMLFQTAAAFWPEHNMPTGGDLLPPSTQLPTTGQTASKAVQDRAGIVYVRVTYPTKNPYLIESPERALQRAGWTILQRRPVSHLHGDANVLKIVDDKHKTVVCILWWFEQGTRRFSNHLYARRVLWSGWHLAERELKYVHLESVALTEPADLIDFANRHQWSTVEMGLAPLAEPGAGDAPNP